MASAALMRQADNERSTAMGHNNTDALAEAVGEGLTTLERALGLHLTTGFYPPLPGVYAPALLEAITAVLEDDGALMIALPDCPIIPATAEKIDGVWKVDADTLVTVCKAWPFVETATEKGL